ncbi:hypothetical protein PSR30_01210 [Pectobacterium carotovorum subsp. carotovorum]|uniref:hypothetical protein n=1 Tax=Pectobacterium carotovorum TaxID=554 RepID=UPI00236613D4|nr:hypothetical protein [Pectobacterium carotovorum]WDF99217.1 hypothetical protein PSR30_01210 [Pectobacterium carotovorum subsp. carotovorum]
MENIEVFLRELRESPITSWVAGEVDETLSQGISMNVKDAATDSKFYELLLSQNITTQERNKRQKYETSRAFTDDEKLEVILKAFEVIYLDLPAIRQSAIINLAEIGTNIEKITFSSAEEEIVEEEKTAHEIKLKGVDEELHEYRELHTKFIREINQ